MGYPALAIRPPEPLLQQYAQAQQVAAGAQEQQLRAIQVQQAQQQLQDQHALTSAMMQWDGQDYKQLPMMVLKSGGSGMAAMQMSQQVLGMRQKASEIAKDDAITAQNNTKTAIDQADQYRGRLLNIAGLTDPAAKQTAWDAEITKEENAGTFQPNQVPHQYPGDDAARAIANQFALGSKLVQEQQERQKLSLDAWKNVGGRLVNAVTGQEIGGLANIPQLNKALEVRWQNLHPGEALPETFSLPPNATPADFERIDKLMEGSERGQLSVKQQQFNEAIRQQMFEMQRDKTDMQGVIGQTKDGRAVMVPAGQAQQLGLQNVMKAPEDTINKALAARHWINLANSQGTTPEDMGIVQLVDKLDAEGKLGAIASRWNEFMTGKVGAGDPEISALRAKMGLSTTLLMQAHVGSRGSAQMLEHFEDLANQKKLDGPTLKAALGAEVNYVQDRAMDPNPPNYGKAPAAAPKAAGGGKVYTQTDVDAAVAAHPGMTAAQVEAAFKAKNWMKQ
jgi:hypothetical protein